MSESVLARMGIRSPAPGTAPADERLQALHARLAHTNPVTRALVAVDPAWVDRGASRPTVAVKDCIDVAGLPTRYGRDEGVAAGTAVADTDHRAVEVLRGRGWNVVGKAATTELNVGARIPNPNPLDPRLSAGGSSTGSAVAVATGMVDAALGTDAGGSIRWPAAYCGVASLRLTPRPDPDRHQLVLCPELDALGLIASSAEDLFDLWTRWDAEQLSSYQSPDSAKVAGLMAPPSLGVPTGAREEISHPGVLRVFDEVLERACRRGARVDWAPLPGWNDRRTGWTLLTADTARSIRGRATVSELSPSVQEFVAAGARVSGVEREQARDRVRALRAESWPDCDVLVLPVDPHPADPVPDPRRPSTVPADTGLGFTMPASVYGAPVVTDSIIDPVVGPVGIQIIGPPGEERQTLQCARWIFSVFERTVSVPEVGQWLDRESRRQHKVDSTRR